MTTFFVILMGIAMAGLVAVLIAGLFVMAHGGEVNKKYGNRLMQLRIWLQGLAIVFFLLAIASRSASHS